MTCSWCGGPATTQVTVASYVGDEIRVTVTEWCADDVNKVRSGIAIRKAMGETIVIREEPC